LILARHTAPPASNATSRGGEAGLRAAIEQHRKHWKI
jgi:hypothetical protein